MLGGWRAACAAKEGLELGGQLTLHPRLLRATQSQAKLKVKLLCLRCHRPILAWAAGLPQPSLHGKGEGGLPAVTAGVKAWKLSTCF